MRSIFKIHPLTYIILLIAFLTGNFKDIILFMLIILVHELGHIISAIIFKWKIEKIVILPFGGITIFNEILNKPLIEEFIIAIMGPLFQIIFTFIFNLKVIQDYSFIILIINLIPIYPLDGAKLLNIFLNKIFSFKLSHKITNYLSFFLALFLMFISVLSFELIYILFTFLIILKVKEELKNHTLIYEKFLYERYIYNLKFKKVKIVKNVNKFYRDYYHYIKDNNKLIEEEQYLKIKYDIRNNF